MSWKKERDLLIAETMAFVQSVTGGREETGRANGAFASGPAAESPALGELDLKLRPAPKPVAPIERVGSAEVSPAAVPAPRPIVPSEFTSEIRARVANFRAHQERFNREREQYFSATLERLRAAINEVTPPRPDK
ncbi:MAG: hypothetical protein JOZ74_12290 [Bradyrhizobium sp.]|nr:hypothetical protein [Bradyrhizobium sp.]